MYFNTQPATTSIWDRECNHHCPDPIPAGAPAGWAVRAYVFNATPSFFLTSLGLDRESEDELIKMYYFPQNSEKAKTNNSSLNDSKVFQWERVCEGFCVMLYYRCSHVLLYCLVVTTPLEISTDRVASQSEDQRENSQYSKSGRYVIGMTVFSSDDSSWNIHWSRCVSVRGLEGELSVF